MIKSQANPKSKMGAPCRQQAAELASGYGWLPVQPAKAFRTGILMTRAKQDKTRERWAEELHETFADEGLAVTSYDGGFIRLSMPGIPLPPHAAECLSRASQSIA